MWQTWRVGLLAACLTLVTAREGRRTYSGYRVYDVAVANASQAASLRRLAAGAGLELWGEDDAAGRAQVQTSPAAASWLERELSRTRLPYRLRIADLQRVIDLETAENRPAAAERSFTDNTLLEDSYDAQMDGFPLDVYHRWPEIEAFLLGVAERYPREVELEVLGYTHERRPLYLLRLAEGPERRDQLPVMWLDCGIHAREWVSPAVCLYAISRLLGPDRHRLAQYEWHILPMMNPDGYVYTHQHDRLWRKNRRPNNYCTGADLNRNFAARWGTFGVTFVECGQTFPGYRPFSERESRAVRDAVLRHRSRLAAFNSMHSYGQLWLIPYGYTWRASPHVRQQRAVARQATRAIRAVNGVTYRYGVSSRLLYLDSGTSTDWAYRVGVKHSVAVEARDKGYYGFLLPPRLILPTVREVWAGLAAQADAVQALRRRYRS